MLRTCPKARGFVLIDYLFATWLMSLLCFFILEAFSLGLWWTRTWEPGPTLKRSCVILPLQVRRLPFWIPICGWKQSESFLNCPRSRNGRQPSMNGLVGGFLPAWYAMKKIRALWPLNVCCSSFFSHSSSAFAQGPAGDLSRCHRSSYPAGNCAGQRWILTAALNIIFVMKHLLFPSKKGARRCAGAMDPFPVSNDPVLCGALAPIWKGNPLHQRPGRNEAAWHQSAHGASFTDP